MRWLALVFLTSCYPLTCPPNIADDLAECRAELRGAALGGATNAEALQIYENCKKRKGLIDG